jgi:hypothetical protein
VRGLRRVKALLDAAARVAETRRGLLVVFLAALAVWWLEAIAIPLGQGRDLGTYVGAYVQLLHSHPIDLGYVLGRTPLSPLVVGGLLDLGGGALAEPVLSMLYAASVAAWFLAARTFNARAAVLAATVLLAYPGYGLLFHELSSDALFAAAFAGWSLLAVRLLRTPTPRRIAVLGAGVGILVLVRPGSQVLLALVSLVLALRVSWRARLVSAAAFVIPAVAIVGALVLHNGLRYDDYTVVRGGNAGVPFYRTFVVDRIVRPENGPASRELAAAVKRELLPQEPYRSYGITLDEFFNDASPRMFVDLVALSNRLWGWQSDGAKLREVGLEAVRTHPGAYTAGVAKTVWQLLRNPLMRTLDSGGQAQGRSEQRGTQPTILVNGRRLPRPTEGEPIPAAHEGGVSTPDYSIRTVWTSPREHHLVFEHAGDKQRYLALQRRIDALLGNLPDRAGRPGVADTLNQLSRWYPPPIVWLVVGLAALAFWRRADWLRLSVPALAGLLVIGVTALAVPAVPQYSIPIVPAFFLLALATLLAPRREHAPGEARAAFPWLDASVRTAAGVVLGVLAAVWAVVIYVSDIGDALDRDRAPHDLEVFLSGAAKVVHGASPYVFKADETYAYPPALAFLVAPLHWLSAGAATLVWTVVSLAAIAAALWLLGLRDWRCYALVAVYPITRSAVDLGTIGPLLLLAVALAWRCRDHIAAGGAATGAAVALKLFLWPLGVWLALTRRVRAALATLGFAVLFVLVPWAVLGFDGLGRYPGLLRHLARDEATSSYSLVAIGARLHLPEAVATVLSLFVAAGFLAAAAWIARGERREPSERDVATLTLVLAAALAASPIVWVHYFLLLVVPLALTRPRLSPLWLLPFAYYPLGESAWPGGDARKLGLAFGVTLVLLLAVVRPPLPKRFSASWPWLRSGWSDVRARPR